MLVQAHREPALYGEHVMDVAPLIGSVHHRLVCTRLCLCACVLVSFAECLTAGQVTANAVWEPNAWQCGGSSAHCETLQASSHVYSNTCSTVSQDRRVRSQTEVTEQWRLVVTGPVCPRG